MRKQIANLITACRILCSVVMLFCRAFSVPFYITYLICGLSDAADGAVARKTGSASPFGAELDTAADLIFTAVMLTKLLPLLSFPRWLWIWIIGIAGIRMANMAVGFVRRKKPIAVHSVMNKVTGLLLFLFPLTLHIIVPIYSAVLLCAAATLSAVQEGYFIRTGREIMM